MKSIFENRTFLIATQHKKELVLDPLLRHHFRSDTFVPEHFDSDQFGSFSGEMERKDDPLTTARKKCLLAMERFNFDLCIASEGSFGPHPTIPFAAADEEWLLLIDRKNNIEIFVSHISTSTNLNGKQISHLDELYQFAHHCKFPSHALIIRNKENEIDYVKKGITNWDELVIHYETTKAHFGQAYIETDMRAMCNPMRMKVIEETMEKLISAMQSTCPNCNAPGFVVQDRQSGLPCMLCGFPTQSTLSHIYRCHHCHFQENKFYPSGKTTEDPMYCDLCNP